MTKSYLVIATPRSGSTLLGQGLQASGVAGEPREFFGHKMAHWMERWDTQALPDYVAQLQRKRSSSNGVFGAKLLYGQLLHLEGMARQEPELDGLSGGEMLRQLFPDLHILWATRDDKLRQAISWFKARQTGVWGQGRGAEEPKLGRAWRLGDEPLQPGELAFDYAGIAALLQQAEAEDAAIGKWLAGAAFTPYRVVYEAYAPRYSAATAEILDWMGIAHPPLNLPDPRTVRLADDRTDEWVARFREEQAAQATLDSE
jgi:LPS sulfotransferase NodH